ncbi:hypothetical protein VOLCADRAFT_98834 [Volvox carteri f. nagariensis]|uniref:Uncharacterized protein n=1 Tax=Volvox carteri f. nagariensis TaxID=3068 RepID=D8UGE3_VOLCA|nr:uncharacterized protein VOLCADRAFT_98834 [Volvox carteri f. nagariensis]EFJ41160.1 hypothetical protein VOLCADRAFT_98834 [Volvox carteri f. nagariensis]|eukprot:XP_002957728.1 hypothetical protein VOLCADRAFT_98834 [Volvox carteri f. nagariensis]
MTCILCTTLGKATHGVLDLDLDDVEGVIEILIDSDDCNDDDDDCMDSSMTNEGIFSSSHEVFVVRGLSKAVSGFRPAITCEGFLASVSRSCSGYTLLPRGTDQQLSFKYEPPSAKFSCRRPGCISYRLQLLHGSQFLYSLRGLPKALRCHRSAHALEWGPVHMVFAAAADLDTFLSTLKYVEVEEMSAGGGGGGAEGTASGAGAATLHQMNPAAATAAGSCCSSTFSLPGRCGSSTTTTATGAPPSRHATHSSQRKDVHRGHGRTHTPHPEGVTLCGCQMHGATGSCGVGVGGPPFFTTTAGAAVLAAVATACLLTQRNGPNGGSSSSTASSTVVRNRMVGSSAAAVA